MNQHLIKIGGAFVLLGAIFPAEAGDPTPRGTHDARSSSQFRTSGYAPVRQLTGDVTLDQAIEIAMRQNPAVLAALQEIQRTRGEIIEVRAAALPQITLGGGYEQQDRKLLRGGGEGGGAIPTSPLSGTNLTTPTAIPAVTSSGATSQTQAITPIAPINTSNTGNAAGGGATGGATTTTIPSAGGTPLSTARGLSSNPSRAAEAERATRATGTGAATASGAGQTTASNTSAPSGQQVTSSQLLQNLGTQNGTAGAFGGSDKSWNVTIEVRQLLYSGGQVSAALNIAKFTQDSAYYSLRDTVDTIISTVRTQFYTVLLDRALINVQEESINLLGQQLKDQKNRFDAGTVPRFNVLQAEVAMANQRPLFISAKNNYLLSQLQLAKTLGLDPGPGGKPGFFCVGDLSAPERHVNLSDALMLARARRPFLKVQRQSILIDAEDIKVQFAGYKPQISAHAAYELRNRSISDELGDTVNGWFFGVTGSWAVFDGFATYGRVKQARARLEEAKLNYDDSVHQVDLQVQTAFSNLGQARETILSQQETVKEAAEAVRLAQERLNAGAGTQLDVLNAQVQLTTSRTTELQARTDYKIALAQYDLATGTETVYEEKFKDPLNKVEKGILGRLAESGLPRVPPADEPPRHHGRAD